MITVNTNVPSLIAQRVLRYNQSQLNLSLERLSTGLRINRASDDPAGLIASENLRSEKVGIQAAIENATRAGNVLSTAEGGLNEVSSLLNQLQGFITQSANQGGLSSEEVAANQLQVDTIVATIDRLSGSTSFGGRKLLNGNLDYSTSGVDVNAIKGLKVNASQSLTAATVNVNVVASAQTALLTYTGGTVGAGGVTIEIQGTEGTTQLAFASGATVSAIAAAVASVRDTIGVSATINGGNLELHSTTYGSKSFVGVRTIAGSFAGATGKDTGRDATVTINGVTAIADGLNVSTRSAGLDVELRLGASINITGGSTSFQVTGGGARFLIGSKVTQPNYTSLGIASVNSGSLGDNAYGTLADLTSGGAFSLSSGKLSGAQKILDASVKSVSYQRARIGAIIKYDINSTINSLQVQYENISDAESRIRDTDFAEEVSKLTRWQILTQAATTVLAQANQAPSLALTLLQGAIR